MNNKIIRNECSIFNFGMFMRVFAVVANDQGRILNQKISTSKEYAEDGKRFRISVKLRFDDNCGNGRETFSITGDIDMMGRHGFKKYSGGCIHDEIAAHFPELAHFIKWHLTSTDGPIHYLANTIYHASDRDYNGLAKGEKRQIKNGKTGKLTWRLKDSSLPSRVDSDTKPEETELLEYEPWCIVGEGKPRDLEAARRSAVWPDATDEQLCLPKDELGQLLTARLPALLEQFKADMLTCGFIWPEYVGMVQA